MVAPTLIKAKALVVNQCNPSAMANAIETVEINPTIRRPNWNMDNVSGLIDKDTDWWKNVESAFPGVTAQTPLGLNDNKVAKYQQVTEQVVTPIYVDLSITNPDQYPPEEWPNGVPNDAGEFSGKITEINTGPNEGFFYNSDTSIYKINRIARLNNWITPAGTWPSIVPNENPNTGDPASYVNWLDIYGSGGQSCGCTNPGAHGAASVADIRHEANYWHEAGGCPSSSNKEKLGHQIRIKEAVEGIEPETYDVLWRCDLLYADSEIGLKIKDENARYAVSSNLLGEAGAVHSFVSSHPQKHNFVGNFWAYDDDTDSWGLAPQNY